MLLVITISFPWILNFWISTLNDLCKTSRRVQLVMQISELGRKSAKIFMQILMVEDICSLRCKYVNMWCNARIYRMK